MKKQLISLAALFAFFAALPLSWAHGMSEADQATAVTGGFGEFFTLGATHMLTGYDHLLFLFGVVFFLTHFKDILKFRYKLIRKQCISKKQNGTHRCDYDLEIARTHNTQLSGAARSAASEGGA